MEYPLTPQILRPPILDGTNYAYWKTKMRIYIKTIDEHAWRSILSEWTSPKNPADEEGEVTVKRKLDWSTK